MDRLEHRRQSCQPSKPQPSLLPSRPQAQRRQAESRPSRRASSAKRTSSSSSDDPGESEPPGGGPTELEARDLAGARECPHPDCPELILEFDPVTGRKTPSHKRTCGSARCSRWERRQRRREEAESQSVRQRFVGTAHGAAGCLCSSRRPDGLSPLPDFDGDGLTLWCALCGRLATNARREFVEPSPQWMKTCLLARGRGIRPPQLTARDLRTYAPRTMLPRERRASEWSDHRAYRCSTDPAVRGWIFCVPHRDERRKSRQLGGGPVSQLRSSTQPAPTPPIPADEASEAA